MTENFQLRRLTVVLATMGIAVLGLMAVAAYACTPMSTLSLKAPVAFVGATVEGTGTGFSSYRQGARAVEVRLDNRSGPVLWAGDADQGGNFSFSFTAPDPGYHVLLAVIPEQPTGSPARIGLTVQATPDQQVEALATGQRDSASSVPAMAGAWPRAEAGERSQPSLAAQGSGSGPLLAIGVALLAVGLAGAAMAPRLASRERRALASRHL